MQAGANFKGSKMTDNELASLLTKVEALIDTLCTGEPGSLAGIVRNHFSAGGSRVRARIALQAGSALGLSQTICVALASGCELLHNASLVHDDLQDRDGMRRNAPSMWLAHGEAIAICAGDLMLSSAYAALAQAGPKAASMITHVHLRVAHVVSGQCEDLRLGGTCNDPEAYEQIAAAKSGPLLALPLELALIAAGREPLLGAASRAATLFAIAYQMLDDLGDADRDAANGSLNAVAVYAAKGITNPRRAVREAAVARLEAFEQTAAELPAGLAHSLVARAAPIRLALGLQPETA
jgi:geranylgeranyl diphosphate synthase, type I